MLIEYSLRLRHPIDIGSVYYDRDPVTREDVAHFERFGWQTTQYMHNLVDSAMVFAECYDDSLTFTFDHNGKVLAVTVRRFICEKYNANRYIKAATEFMALLTYGRQRECAWDITTKVIKGE